ncbi:MAG: hypothetical protein AAFV95_05035 [Bacteroidota bacterium]
MNRVYSFLWLLVFLTLGVPLRAESVVNVQINSNIFSSGVLQLFPTEFGVDGLTISDTSSMGNFSFALSSPRAVPAIFYMGDVSLFLFVIPDQGLNIELVNQVNGRLDATFTGEAGPENLFYQQYQQFVVEETQKRMNLSMRKMKPRKFLKIMLEEKKAKEFFLYKEGRAMDKRLLEWLQIDIDYDYGCALLDFPSAKGMARNPSTKYYQFLEDLPLNKDGAILHQSYRDFLVKFMQYKLAKPNNWGLVTTVERQYKYVKRFFFGLALQYVRYYLLSGSVKYEFASTFFLDVFDDYLDSDAPEVLKERLIQSYNNAPYRALGAAVPTNWFKGVDLSALSPDFFQGDATFLYLSNEIDSSTEWHLLQKLSIENRSEKNVQFVQAYVGSKQSAWKAYMDKQPERSFPNLKYICTDYRSIRRLPGFQDYERFPCVMVLDRKGRIFDFFPLTTNWAGEIQQALYLMLNFF